MSEKHNQTLAELAQDICACTKCPLYQTRTHAVPGTGNPVAKLVLIGEGPGENEDLHGLPFVGRAGSLLTKMMLAAGLTREEVFITNLVKCRPPKNRTPLTSEIRACEPYLFAQLRLIQPKIICTLGAPAAMTLLGKKGSMTTIRGKWFTYQGIRLMPTFHPSYLLRVPSKKQEFMVDLQAIMNLYRTL